jgi:myo-inositol 2-dehydrogenase / D-chiro-inositol 1-dehydrogenase
VARVEPVRLAVIGAGRMGRTHLRALAHARAVEAVAAVDPVDGVRAGLEREGLLTWSSADELLDAGGFDAVLIAAPTDLHLGLVTRFAGAGLPILCEKPCGLHAGETAQAVRAAADADIVLQVGYWRRFVPALVTVRERLLAGAYGSLLFVSCWQWDAQPPAASFRERSGGILLDMGVHEFDQLRWLTGREIEEVIALAAAPDADSATALVHLDDGTGALVSLGRMFPHGDCCWLELMGTSEHVREPFMWGEGGVRVFQDALVAQAEAFAGAVRGEAPRGATGEDAIRAIEAADRAAQSLATPRE